MTMTTIKKVLKQTPLVGRVINSLKSENPEENAPSIQAVLDNLQPKQLLINNDFQINQRAQTLYNGDYTKYTYTVDMWRIVTTSQSETCTLEKLTQGIKFSSNGTGRANFEQQIKVDTSKNHMAVCYIRNLVGNGIFSVTVGDVWHSTELKNGLNIINVSSDNNCDRCLVALLDTASCEIEYIDLFEGNIVYPHIKEDKAIALMRCQTRLLILKTVDGYFSTAAYYISDTRIQNMEAIPICNVTGNITVRLDGNSYTFTVSDAVVTSRKAEIKLTISNFESIKNEIINRTISGLTNEKIIISCEPL